MTMQLHPFGGRIALRAALAIFLLACVPMAASDGLCQDPDAVEDIEEVVVHGHPLGGDISQSTDVLEGDELEQAMRHSIGETLAQTPGVHSASFGPAVGHPVIHGLSGTRVLVLENHVSSLDVSTTSGDHGIAVEPFLANRIEVIKGSSTLLYGSGAIGGAVDVHTDRIPVEVQEDALSGRMLIRGDTGSDSRYVGFRLDGGGGQWAWHLDGYSSDNGDLTIPGYAAVDPHHEDEEEEAEEEEHHDEEEEAEEDHEEEPVEGVLGNSFGDYSGGSFGFAYVGDRAHIGAAVVVRDWAYGIVGEHLHGAEDDHEEEAGDEEEGEDHDEEEGEHEEESNPWIVLEQTKFMSEFGLHDPLPGFTSLEGSFTVSDYEHNEIESEGVVASHYANDAWELRVVMEAEPRGDWETAVGIQFGRGDFVFAGDAAFEPVETNHRAVFGVAQRDFEGFNLETGARLEYVEHSHASQSRDFLTSSISVGVVVPVESWEFTARLDRSMRAPKGEELFAAGTHLAIGGFQRGSSELDEEKSINLSAGAMYRGEGLEFGVEGYRYAFDDFIYQREIEDEHDGLEIIQWWQSEATLVGVDAEARIELLTKVRGSADLVIGYDWVTTDIEDPHESHLPRIPPQRLSIAAEVAWKDYAGRIAYSRYSDQDEVTEHETPTDGYGNLDVEGEYAAQLGEANVVFFVAGRNLGDEEQRQHSSFVKDEAPLAGRRVEAGVRIWF